MNSAEIQIGRIQPRNAHWLGRIGVLLLLVITLAAVFAPQLTVHDPQELVAFPFQAPDADHLLGTDDVGHDIWSQLVHGARLSLLIGMVSALLAVGIGTAVALVAGYYGGLIDKVLMRLVDVTLSFPFLPLVIVLAAFLGRELGVTIVAITIVLWARPALILHSQVIKIRTFEHVTAATAMGATAFYVIVRHVLLRLLPLVVAQFVRAANVAIFLEAALAFLGLGNPNRISWGTMLYFANTSSAMLTDAWQWWVLPVGLALTATIVSLALIGYGLEAWADPRLARGNSAETSPPLTSPPVPTTLPVIDAPVLAVQNVSIWYGVAQTTPPVVEGASFAIGAGNIVGLIGESGCGKSTLAMSLLRLRQGAARTVHGAAWLGKRDLFALSADELVAIRGRHIALVPQNAMNALNPVYTILKQLNEVTGSATRSRELLKLVGIPTERQHAYPHQLSGGMRQRIVVAMAVANKPQLLIADEPTTGLDVVTQLQILRLLRTLRDQSNMAILLISHDLRLIGNIADQLLVMQGGRIVESGAASQILAEPCHPHTQLLLQVRTEET